MNTTAHTDTDTETRSFIQTEGVVEAAQRAGKRLRKVTKLRTLGTFLRRGACSTTLMTVLDRAWDQRMDTEERAADPLAGGLMRGYQCGMIWGSALASGARAHHLHGDGPVAEAAAMRAAETVIGSFRGVHGTTDCMDITETDPQQTWQAVKYFLFMGGTVRCARRISRYAPRAHRDLEESLAAAPPRTGCDPASCAARLARSMGASERHATMVAGLAGGIGLSGGACGALGAAVWLIGVQGRTAGDATKVINQRVEELMERFQEATGYELECADIVGRRFADIDDHSAYVRRGGCAALLDTLAVAATELTCVAAKEKAAA